MYRQYNELHYCLCTVLYSRFIQVKMFKYDLAFYVMLTVQLDSILVNNQPDAHFFFRIQGVSGGIVNILVGGSMDYSE